MKLRIGLLALIMVFAHSTVVEAKVCKDDAGKIISCPCLDANDREVPGYVQADCSAENARVKKSSCQIHSLEAPTLTVGTGDTQEAVEVKTDIPAKCKVLLQDLESCETQCVPKVTNGSILPGPRDGSTARKYLLGNFLPNITNSFLIFYMIMGVVFVIVSGVMWIMASSNPEMTERAQNTMVWAIIGLSIGVFAYVAVQFVININFFA